MTGFIIHFLISNIWISCIAGFLFIFRKLLKKTLTARTNYHLWFLFLGLLAAPFLPLRSVSLLPVFSWLPDQGSSAFQAVASETAGSSVSSEAAGWMNDFTLSVSRHTPAFAGTILLCVWIAGIAAAAVAAFGSWIRLRRIRKSALPLQDLRIKELYEKCLKELKITKEIPIYSTAFLASPVIIGLFHPCIYLPIRLISSFPPEEIRYILLHELQHYRYKDNLSNYLIIPASICYWFSPPVRCALNAMRRDREIACDSAVLRLLDKASRKEYGLTLLHFAEKSSFSHFPFTSALGGSTDELRQRILNIAAYSRPAARRKIKNILLFFTAAVLLLASVPVLAFSGKENDIYEWDAAGEHTVSLNLSDMFGTYDGSFVLYDQSSRQWSFYDRDMAARQVSPDSTYKIYDALFALEEEIITPESSLRQWDKKSYPFDTWNRDQTLRTAMLSSVNWYFNALDEELGRDVIQSYIRKIGYGNEKADGALSSYWMESSLKISAIEQVELLVSFCRNDFGFAPENIQAVKDSIRLDSSSSGILYGKTGTGKINGNDRNGWFVGFVEAAGNTWFFAVNIQGAQNASGSVAARIALSVLSDMGIWSS